MKSISRMKGHHGNRLKVDWFFNDHIHQLQSLNLVKPLVRIHGDLVFSNIILTPKSAKIVFIDWEYSTLADPCIDVAYFITQNQLTHSLQRTFVEKFEEKLGYQIPSKVLELTCDLMDLMSGLWYVIQAARLRPASTLISNQQSSFIEFLTLAQDRFHTLQLI